MKRIYLIIIVLLAFSVSCTENFDDFNAEEKNPTEVEGEFLFTNGTKELVDQISSTNVNLNVWKLFAQYWTETTYTDEENYDIVNRTIPDNTFDTYYTNVIKNFDEAKKLIEADPLGVKESEQQKTNKLMIIELLEIYAYHNMVNIFGDIPYNEAMDINNISPVYNDAASIYSDLISRINNVLANLQAGIGTEEKPFESFKSADIIYGGDVQSWIRFANSLKFKIAINAADVDDKVDFSVQTVIQEAISGGIISSPSENAILTYRSATPNTNPLYEDLILSGRKDFVPANTIVDTMVGMNDPRLDDFFSNKIDTSDNDIDDPVWLGGDYGFSASYSGHSHLGSAILLPDFPGFLITYTELQFYKAEAAARGYTGVGQTAEEAYNDGVEASIMFWGGTSTEANNYLAAYPYDGGNWKASIGLQSWLASYTRGFIGYTTYRRLDQPDIMNTPDPDVYKTTDGVVPTRFTYPVNEQTLNAENYSDAAAAIGGDKLETTLFWDVSTPF